MHLSNFNLFMLIYAKIVMVRKKFFTSGCSPHPGNDNSPSLRVGLKIGGISYIMYYCVICLRFHALKNTL